MEEILEGYTRVSEIISQWNQLAHIDPAILANKCRIGSEVHEAIAAEIDGIYIPCNEDCESYILSWKRWHEEFEKTGKIVETEKRFYCDELKITGAVDGIIEVGDVRGIIDYKTSSSANMKMWGLQASFYHYLANVNGWEVDPHVCFVHLRKDGKIAKEREVHCTEELWEVAKSALHTFRYLNG